MNPDEQRQAAAAARRRRVLDQSDSRLSKIVGTVSKSAEENARSSSPVLESFAPQNGPVPRMAESKGGADRPYPVVQSHNKTLLPGDKEGAVGKLYGTASTTSWANYPVEDTVKPRTVSRKNTVGLSSLQGDLQKAVSKTRLPCLIFALLLGGLLGGIVNDQTGSAIAQTPVAPFQHVLDAMQRAWNLQFSRLYANGSRGSAVSLLPGSGATAVKEDYTYTMERIRVFGLGLIAYIERQPLLTILGVNLTVISAVLIALRVHSAGISIGVQSIKESSPPKFSLSHQIKSLWSWFLIFQQIMAHIMNTAAAFILAYACCHLRSAL